MDNSLKIRCKNNNKVITAPLGSTLSEVYASSGLDMEYGPMAALVNNKVQGMNFRFYNNKDVEFLSLYSMTGMRTYVRTLFLVLVKAAEDLYPDKKLLISAPVNGGFYSSCAWAGKSAKKTSAACAFACRKSLPKTCP